MLALNMPKASLLSELSGLIISSIFYSFIKKTNLNNMKSIVALIGLIALSACGTEGNSYTSRKYFDCTQTNEFKPITDKQKLIYEILERAVIAIKDIPEYSLIKDKKNIYINKAYYSKFEAPTKADVAEYQFENNEIPTIINDVRFCLKSRAELQKIADNTTDFVFLTLGCIEIKEKVATIGI